MNNALLFSLKQKIKMYIQNRYLPRLYDKLIRRTEVIPGRIIMADMHSRTIPFSMKVMYSYLKKKGHDPLVYMIDMESAGPLRTFLYMRSFMKEYAAAEYIFICSYFLPVSSCRKRPETKVVQLWHSGGLLKKMGLDTRDDIPDGYKGNVTANYDVVTVSAPVCEAVWESAWGLPKGTACATGLSRTDIYSSDSWNRRSRELF